jgi:tetratricopeptide (TPR) repeat protein
MITKELDKEYNEICSNLSDRTLKPAFDKLGILISENGLGMYYDEYRNLEETYHLMLKYTVEGIRDPERQKVYQKLIVSVYELADKINESLRQRYSTSVEYENKRATVKTPAGVLGTYIREVEDYYTETEYKSITDKEKQRDDDQINTETRDGSDNGDKILHEKMKRLFFMIWFSDNLTSEDKKPLHGFLTSSEIPAHYRGFMISALTLSLQRYFQEEKFIMLFDACGYKEPEVNQRALVGLMVNLYKYDSRTPFYPEITNRLKILSEDSGFKSNLERIILQLIKSKETEKLQQRIRDEILPGMIKISPNLKNKINLDSLMEEGLSEDKNPEWEEIFKDSPDLLDKMQEFSEMQMKGADVFMGSFSMLKNFPFFSEISNWFIPFFPENPELTDTLDMADPNNRQLTETINRAPILCNSDKYSFCHSIQKLPKENLGFMTQAMNAEMDQLKEIQVDEELLDPGRKAGFISNQYIQDLYRFYKLFPRKGDFEDIFNWRLDFHNKLAFSDILKDDPKTLRNIAEYYFAGNHFEEAAEIFGYLLEQNKNGELYQKRAWCYQKTGDYEKALDGYLKAELFDVNKLWNQKKIALCYRNIKQPARALEYYQSIEKLEPESLSNQLNIGHCLLELDRFDEALKCYFKVEYLAPGNKKVWRPIAWCSFLTGKKEQAEKYFSKLMDDEPNRHDLLNMGHVQWSLGNRKAALDYYQRSISKHEEKTKKSPSAAGHKASITGTGLKERFSESEFINVFREDLPHLLRQGIDKDDVPIMLDQLRYFLEE